MLPKFKAWDRKHNEMIDVVSINFEEGFIRGITAVEINGDIESSYNLEDVDMIQSTGIKDRHGNEYFNKDVAIDVYSDEMGVIEYEDGAFYMMFENSGVLLIDVNLDFEIIGNKYENPINNWKDKEA